MHCIVNHGSLGCIVYVAFGGNYVLSPGDG